MRLRSLSLGPRLTAGFAAVAFLLLAVAVVGGTRLVALRGLTREVTGRRWQMAVAAADLSAAANASARAKVSLLVLTNAAQVAGAKEALAESRARINQSSARLDSLAVTPGERALVARVAAARKAHVPAFDSVLALHAAGRGAAAAALYAEAVVPTLRAYQDAIDAVRADVNARVGAAAEAADAGAAAGFRLLAGFAGAALLLAGVAAWRIPRSITRPLAEVAERAERLRAVCITGLGAASDAMGRGDLTVRLEAATDPLVLEGRDEVTALGRTVNGIIEQTRATVRSFDTARAAMGGALARVAGAADGVSAAAAQIAAGGGALASGASEQASSLEEVSASLQDFSVAVRRGADGATDARRLADGAQASADAGVAAMRELSEAVARIKASSDATADIVRSIDELAFQTSLLALNAAVEAARAGDAGRGFAVVADEVRALAQRSAAAAKRTTALIAESSAHAESGVAINGRVLAALGEIDGQVRGVTAAVAEIAAAGLQQSNGVAQITQAVEQVNVVTQQTAANAEESAAAAAELATQAAAMRALVGAFTWAPSDDAPPAPPVDATGHAPRRARPRRTPTAPRALGAVPPLGSAAHGADRPAGSPHGDLVAVGAA